MGDSHTFAIDVVQTICDRLDANAADLHHLFQAGSSFDGWLECEAYLACLGRLPAYPFCEVVARPTYGSEGVVDADGQPSAEVGGLRVGGSGQPGDHRWAFVEFVVLHDAGRSAEWRAKTEAATARLLRLGWKRSAALLVLVAPRRGNVPANEADDLSDLVAWHRPALVDPHVLALPGGGSVVVKAIDIKRDLADTLAPSTR